LLRKLATLQRWQAKPWPLESAGLIYQLPIYNIHQVLVILLVQRELQKACPGWQLLPYTNSDGGKDCSIRRTLCAAN
jgi:hypothetical protein